ncbi:hypothetical protein LAZ67_8000146 [Cordylochernes scorpioides]|uniref:Uncharacterized protein n=1 Tax=Cordylochernes scorpioides TaxID=51811 RepID=A0ABY6KP43_9ARAC|nr:hypothetical protein LAZ67_8000146 [Cordylochernes scorpioides]
MSFNRLLPVVESPICSMTDLRKLANGAVSGGETATGLYQAGRQLRGCIRRGDSCDQRLRGDSCNQRLRGCIRRVDSYGAVSGGETAVTRDCGETAVTRDYGAVSGGETAVTRDCGETATGLYQAGRQLRGCIRRVDSCDQRLRGCIRRGGSCDHRPSDCCYSSSCRCNLWGTNCRCQRAGLFQRWG